MSGSGARWPHLLGRPQQGWSSLVLLLGMLVLLGVSLTEARLPALSEESVGASLVVLMVAGGLIGYVLARSSLGVVKAHIIGAAVGAGLILLIAGAALGDQGGPIPGSWPELQATMALLYERVQADLRGVDTSIDYVPAIVIYLLFGAICWTTAQFSAFSIFRYDRGGPAVLAIGVVLFLNLYLGSIRVDDDLLPMLPQLVLFAALAMLTLMRLQLTHQRHQWARRHIADAGDVSRLFLRTGTMFVALAVVGASSLTIAATTGPHEPDLDELQNIAGNLGDELSGLFPFLNVPRDPNRPRSIGDKISIGESWTPGQGTAFTARIDGGSGGNYWWQLARDQFDGWNWTSAAPGERRIGAGEDFSLTPGRWDGPWQSRVATIAVEDLHSNKIALSPADAYEVSEPVELALLDRNESVGMIEFQEDSVVVREYEVSADVREYGDRTDALTATELQRAGDRYPRWVSERYLQGVGDPRVSGRLTEATADRIFKARNNAYDRAVMLQNELRDMRYTTDLGGICDGLNVPECVLEHKRGFCQYYASTMAMVLREMGIPSRMVQGFLPGKLQEDGSWMVENQASHAWVEAFFPGYGWIRFDPTPGRRLEQFNQTPTALRDGEEPEPPGPDPTPDVPEEPDPNDPVEPSALPTDVDPEACSDGCPDEDDGALAAFLISGGIAGLLLVTIGVLLYLRLRRLPMADGGTAYRGIVRLATRLGRGPHPAQTEYEFAASLSESMPGVRDDLYLVTASGVETTYGHGDLDAAQRTALRGAYRRIRTALLRLSLRLRRSG